MKKALYILALIIALPGVCYSDTERLIELELFGCMKDSITNSDTDSIFLNKVRSQYKIKFEITSGEVQFAVDEKYTFQDLPCITAYSLSPKLYLERYLAQPLIFHGWFLYNKCDIALYYFGDKTESFEQVTKNYLPEIIKKGKFKELLAFYINVQDPEKYYYILDSTAYLAELWTDLKAEYDSLLALNDMMGDSAYSSARMRGDLRKAAKKVKPLSIEQDKNRHKIKLYTWEPYHGTLEYWEFEIKENRFNCRKRKEIIKQLGPRGDVYYNKLLNQE
jgi:hypothetical protein